MFAEMRQVRHKRRRLSVDLYLERVLWQAGLRKFRNSPLCTALALPQVSDENKAFSELPRAMYCNTREESGCAPWRGKPVTGKGDKLPDGRVRQARYASTKQALCAIRTAVSQ